MFAWFFILKVNIELLMQNIVYFIEKKIKIYSSNNFGSVYFCDFNASYSILDPSRASISIVMRNVSDEIIHSSYMDSKLYQTSFYNSHTVAAYIYAYVCTYMYSYTCCM